MDEPVKPTRRYDSPRRREQAAATRRQILEAAQRLFEQDGYAATTMAAIAAEAGVALKTVYLAFETKSGVLRALWHLLLRGDQEDVAVGQRAWYRELLDERDPQRQVLAIARMSRTVKTRAAALMAVIRDAAPSDPDIAALWSRINSDFHENQRTIVETMHKRRALRPGLGVARGADILWTLNHPDVWQLLVVQRGWSPQEYEDWLASSVREQLLRPPTPRGRAARGGRGA
jgi:AcrR family transcriptional regulator